MIKNAIQYLELCKVIYLSSILYSSEHDIALSEVDDIFNDVESCFIQQQQLLTKM